MKRLNVNNSVLFKKLKMWYSEQIKTINHLNNKYFLYQKLVL